MEAGGEVRRVPGRPRGGRRGEDLPGDSAALFGLGRGLQPWLSFLVSFSAPPPTPHSKKIQFLEQSQTFKLSPLSS